MKQTIRMPHGEKSSIPHLIRIEHPENEFEIILEDRSAIDIVFLTGAASCNEITISQTCRIGTESSLRLRNVSLAGSSIVHHCISHIQGEDSESSLDWIFYGRGREKHTLSARNIFDAPRGRGEMMIHGVAEDYAHVSFNGFIEITKSGVGTNTYLTEKTLMLDPTAKVDAVPALEIKTNDVKASHSATVSKVNPEDLFYFSSRGIAESVARQMYIEGFLGALITSIPDASIRDEILMEIAKKYEKRR